jgi:hypothetical protein
MPDLNLAESAVQPYMFEPTKGTEGKKSASGSEENSDSDDDLEISHNYFDVFFLPMLSAVWFTCVDLGTCDVGEKFFQGK